MPISDQETSIGHGSPACDADVVGPGGVSRSADEVTRLSGEVAELNRRLRHAQRLASLGTTAPILAHEIKNLMTPVLGYAKFALDQNDVAMMPQVLQTTVERIGAVMAMTERLLAMATDGPAARVLVGVAAVIDEAVQCLCRDPIKDKITLTRDVPERLRVLGDARQLQQVFFNLLLNARDALHGQKGRIAIAARAVEDHSRAVGGAVEVTVADSGEGIGPEHMDRVFEAFFTTKNGSGNGSTSGSGLGLAICRDIIREHGGDIRVASSRGAGTTFTITLPKGG